MESSESFYFILENTIWLACYEKIANNSGSEAEGVRENSAESSSKEFIYDYNYLVGEQRPKVHL
jgi:hypothetical protein